MYVSVYRKKIRLSYGKEKQVVKYTPTALGSYIYICIYIYIYMYIRTFLFETVANNRLAPLPLNAPHAPRILGSRGLACADIWSSDDFAIAP